MTATVAVDDLRASRVGKVIAFMGLLLIAFLVPSVAPHAAASSASTGVTGIIIPLYSYPGSDWSNLVWAKTQNPNVPMVAIVNPDDGPGFSVNLDYTLGVNRLQSAGVTVLGYIWTDYGARSIASVEQAIQTYSEWYGVNGVYLDQMASVSGYQSYYWTLTAYAESLGMTMVVGNPGSNVPASYIGTVNTMIVYENPGLPGSSTLSGIDTAVSKDNFAIIAYGVSSLNTGTLDSLADHVGYIYLTNGIQPNPYDPESSYLDNLATALSQYDTTAGTITVTTVSTGGSEIWGMYTTLWSNGVKLQSCFSPCTFAVQGGQSYQVEVSNYASYNFSEWANGLTSRSFPVSEPSTATQLGLWAVYNT